MFSGLIFQTTGLFLTLINALVVASSQCQMTMVSYSNHTTKSSSSNLDHINYILETIRISTHSTLRINFSTLSQIQFERFLRQIHFSPRFFGVKKFTSIGVERSQMCCQLAARAIRAPPKALKHHAWLHLSFQPFYTVIHHLQSNFLEKCHLVKIGEF